MLPMIDVGLAGVVGSNSRTEAAAHSIGSRHCTASAAAFAGIVMSSSSPEMAEAASSSKKFKGVRKRKWGKWVSEIRLPNSRERIWLGSYDAPDKAARAFDAAFVCLRGRGAAGADLNFPNSPPPCRPGGCSSDPREVQAAALSHANRAAVTAQQAAAALIMDDADAGCAATTPWDYYYSVAHDAGGGVLLGGAAATSAAEVVAPVRADGSIDWRPVMAHPPPLFSPTGWGSNAYDFLQVPPPVADEDMDDGIHGTTASLWSFDSRDSYFRY